LNTNIPCPPFSEKLKSKEWNENCICWWDSKEKITINKMTPIINILRSHDMVIRTLKKNKPLNIKYRDKFQIVTEVKWQNNES